MTTVVVAGGGLAGLVAARHLADAGADVRLFERNHAVGGRVRSTRREGYVFDRGFQVLFTAYPAARRELDLDALDLRRFAPGAVLARPGHRGVLSDPLRDPGGALESLFNQDATLLDKLRVLKLRRELAEKPDRDIFAGRGCEATTGDRTTREQTTRKYLEERGFSESFVERFVAPFYGGITLDRALGTSSRVFEFTFKMLTTGDIAVPARGMGAISEQLADRARDAGAAITTDETVTDIAHGTDAAADEVDVELGRESTTADAVVVATDPKQAQDLTGVSTIPTDAKGCVTQYCAFDGPKLDAGKRLLLDSGGRTEHHDPTPNQVAQLSAVAPEYAPDDRNLLSATYLGVPELPDDDLAERTRETVAAWYPERNLDLDALHTTRIEFAQFAQPPGIYDDLPDVRDPDGPVYLAGEFTEASSLNAAMQSGRKAASAVASDLELGRAASLRSV